ncbi:hypothetical protein [Ruegeria sp. ANG-R]|uniref:hypothetical protein n=1 Tax=Ruegeria sp. ANG-R TaxID=1577903 RepID=UPI000A9DF47D|nr:hypothetical protein [Ruegeria sp. ANG-R]
MMEEPAWVKVCRNCGHYKPQRKRRPRLTFDEILKLKDDNRLRSKRDRAIFHAFADAGVWAEYKEVCEEYAEICRERGIAKYAILLHWALNTYHRDKLAEVRKGMKLWEVNHHINSIKGDLKRAAEMLDALKAKEVAQ